MRERDRTCLLCGATSRNVEYRWVRWREAHDGSVFGTIDRCRDRDACRRRVEARGDAWEVDDGHLDRAEAAPA